MIAPHRPAAQHDAPPQDLRNVLGTSLQTCSTDPLTGYTRNGCCVHHASDPGRHTVCAVMTDDFLRFTVLAGNDLVTPQPQYRFPGLKPGDRWCLCAARWKQAFDAGHAPPVILEATHHATLDLVPLHALQAHALPNGSPPDS